MSINNINSTRLSFTQQIIITIIFIDIYYVLGFGFRFGATVLGVIQILLFVIVLSSDLDPTSVKKTFVFKPNLFLIVGYISFFLFLYSSFYVNIGYNNNIHSIVRLLSYIVIILLFFFKFSKMLFKNDLLFEKFLNIWIFFALACTIIAWALSAMGIELNVRYGFLHTSIFKHPNAFAFVFTFAVPMVIYKYFAKRISLTVFIVFIMILMIGLLLTYSRAGYIGVFVAILIITFKKSKKVFFLSLVILIFLALTFFIDYALSKTSSSFSRTQIMFVALKMILSNGRGIFLWGYGVTNAGKVFRNEIAVFGPDREELDPHNFEVLLGIQFGVLFALSIIACILILLIKIIFLKKKLFPFDFRQKINLSISIVIGMIVENQFEDMIVYPESFVMLLFLIFLGYLYFSIYHIKEKFNLNDKTSIYLK